jgi:hypothetical protein
MDWSWIDVPETLEEKVFLFDKIAPSSCIATARKGTPAKKSVPKQPPPAFTSPLPPTIEELAASFLSSTEKGSVDPCTFMDFVRTSVTAELAESLEEATREQSLSEEWSCFRYARITASKANVVRSFMGPRGGFHAGKTPVSAMNKVRILCHIFILNGITSVFLCYVF